MRSRILALASAGATVVGVSVAVAGPAQASAPYSWCSSVTGDFHSFADGLGLYNQNSSSDPQTLCGNSGSDWQATTTAPAGNTGVESYPDSQLNFTSPGGPSVASMADANTSSVTENQNVTAGTSAEAAWDIWLDNPATPGSRDEVMIWNDTINRGTVGGATFDASATFNGVTWQLWHYGQEKIWYLPNNQASITVYWAQMLHWMQSNGYLSTGDTMSQFEYGFEVCSTGGASENFDVTGYSITVNGTTYGNGGGGGTQQAPAVTTNAASGVTSSGATLNGTVNPEGAATTYQFQYGTTAAYGTNVPSPAGSAGSGTTAVSESAGITGLAPSTTYHYRITATNSAGTSNGADQTFTTSAAGGGGTVTYAATGPGSAGKTCGNCSSLSWSFTQPSGSDPAVLVGVSVGSNSSQTVTVTDNGTAMAAKTGKLNTDNQSAGFLQVFGLTGIPAGTNTIVVTVSGLQPVSVTGGSESFTGVSQSATYGTVVTAFGSGTLAKASTAGSFSGDMVTGFAANGSPINSAASPATSRFIANHDNSTGAGNSAGATSPATGSGVTISWNVTSDWWAVALVPLHHD